MTHTYVLLRPMPCDNCVYLRYSHDWANGAKLYSERYEPKTPVVFWLFRLLDSRNPRLSVYLGSAILYALAGNAMRRTLEGGLPQAASVAPVFLIIWIGSVGFQHLYDGFAAPLSVLVFAYLGRAAMERFRFVVPLIAGALFAIVVGLFLPASLYALAFLPLFAYYIVQHGYKPALVALMMCVLGFGLVVLGISAHAVAFDYWDGFLDAMSASRDYGSVNRVALAEHFQRWKHEITRLVLSCGPVMIAAVLASTLGVILRWRSRPAILKAWFITGVIWLLTAQLGTFPGGRHFTNYYSFLVGPLALLGALGLAVIPDFVEWRRARLAILLAYGVAAGLMNGLGNYDQIVAVRKKSPEHSRTQIANMSAYFAIVIPENEPVLVCTWGDWAELYWQAPRPSPSRHVIPWNLSETRPEFFAEWADNVLAHPPEWIITDNLLVGPGVTDEEIRKRADPFGRTAQLETPSFVKLRAFVQSEYEVVNGTGGCLVLRRIKSEKPRP